MFFPCTFHRSLALGQQYSSLGSQPILCGSIPGLVPKQLRFCRNYIEIMPSVAEGVKLGIQECQHQFRGRRWNCTTIKDNLAIFGPVLDKGKGSRIVRLCEKGLVLWDKKINKLHNFTWCPKYWTWTVRFGCQACAWGSGGFGIHTKRLRVEIPALPSCHCWDLEEKSISTQL